MRSLTHFDKFSRITAQLMLLGLIIWGSTIPDSANAQRHSGYCDDAESTADFQSCIKTHNEASKQKLNKVYKEILGQQERESDHEIMQAQKDWLKYRDTQCRYEAGLTDNEALKHVYETSCLTALTQFRAQYLEDLKTRKNKSLPHEFSNQPRWVNILTNSYPGIFWRYGEWISVDLDCDGEKEDIMTGLDVSHKNQDPSVHSTLVVAVADTPETGKPKATIHYIPVIPAMQDPAASQSGQEDQEHAENQTVHLCDANVDMAIISHAAVKEQNTEGAPKSCNTVLQINDSLCKPLQLYKNGSEDYKLEFFSPSAGEEILTDTDTDANAAISDIIDQDTAHNIKTIEIIEADQE